MSKTCDHPYAQRWQYIGFWMCCACYTRFWGDKADTELKPVYAVETQARQGMKEAGE